MMIAAVLLAAMLAGAGFVIFVVPRRRLELAYKTNPGTLIGQSAAYLLSRRTARRVLGGICAAWGLLSLYLLIDAAVRNF